MSSTTKGYKAKKYALPEHLNEKYATFSTEDAPVIDLPPIVIHPRKREFNQYRDLLDMTLPEIAVLIGKSWSATRKYAAVADIRLPPVEVLAIMRKAVDLKKQNNV